MKKISISLAVLILTLCFGINQSFAQDQVKTVGTVFVEVKKGSFDIAIESPLIIIPSFANNSVLFAIPIKDKIFLTLGRDEEIFFCYHCINYKVTVSTLKKVDDEINVYLHIASDEPDYFRKKFKLKKGETKFLKLKHGFNVRASYED